MGTVSATVKDTDWGTGLPSHSGDAAPPEEQVPRFSAPVGKNVAATANCPEWVLHILRWKGDASHVAAGVDLVKFRLMKTMTMVF